MVSGRALRAGWVIDVACSALVARAPRERRIASTLACRLCSVRCDGRSFFVAVHGRRELRAGGIGDVVGSASAARGASETRAACALACCVTAV